MALKPILSIIIPTYNEEEHIGRCLDCVYTQTYPKNRLDVLVIDDNSTDKTRELASQFPARIITKDPTKHKKGAEPSKVIGYSLAKGELFLYLDADCFLSEPKYLEKLVNPLTKHKNLAGSFTRFIPDPKNDPPINRYLSYHPFHLDPLLEWICYPLGKTFIKKSEGFMWCKFKGKKIPPIGICIYRMKDLKKIIKDIDTFNWIDIEIPLLLAESGKNLFAYIPDSGHYHLTVKNISDLLKQKRRDATKTYLPALGNRKFTYVDFSSPWDIIRLFLFILYANTLVGPLLRGLYKSFKYKDSACLYELPVTTIITDYVCYLFITYKIELAFGKECLNFGQ